MDESLMTFVNILGVITFASIVAYHFITATPKDAALWIFLHLSGKKYVEPDSPSSLIQRRSKDQASISFAID